jgi:hypothetical protein
VFYAGFDAAADIAREVVAEKDAEIALLKASLQASPVGELTARALQAEKSFADERACCESHQDAYHRIKSELDIVKMNAESIKRFCETNHAPGVAPDKMTIPSWPCLWCRRRRRLDVTRCPYCTSDK